MTTVKLDSSKLFIGGVEVTTDMVKAAPDMYEALEAALNYIENSEGEWGVTLGCGDKARAALAKARGES